MCNCDRQDGYVCFSCKQKRQQVVKADDLITKMVNEGDHEVIWVDFQAKKVLGRKKVA